MRLAVSAGLLALPVTQILASPLLKRDDSDAVNVTTCNGQKYVYEELAGFGFLPSNARDKYGDTIGGFGSGIAIDRSSFKFTNGSYTGTLYGQPDRGWNTEGTINTQSRIHKFTFTLTLADNATVDNPSPPNVQLTYVDTVLFTGPDGNPATGLDATDVVKYDGFPDLPFAKYTGNGFGQDGPGGARVPLDTEGLVLGDDGTFWSSDEYGPYVYQFSSDGKMIQAIRPPDAFIPMRNGNESFSADSPPLYDPSQTVDPADPDTGRANNQGFEALTRSPDGKYLYCMIQSALIQDGGAHKTKRRNVRLLKYAMAGSNLTLEAEYAVQLPIIADGKVAAQSEMHYISDTQFLVLARDSGAGHGTNNSESIYRNADVIDISGATNVLGQVDASDGQIASDKGKLNDDITPAQYCSWLSYNVNSQLNRFGVHNGGEIDQTLINEKWESFAVLPVSSSSSSSSLSSYSSKKSKDDSDGDEYFLISISDNDFITQDGYVNFGNMTYQDKSGFNVDSQILVFRVKFPKGSNPL